MLGGQGPGGCMFSIPPRGRVSHEQGQHNEKNDRSKQSPDQVDGVNRGSRCLFSATVMCAVHSWTDV